MLYCARADFVGVFHLGFQTACTQVAVCRDAAAVHFFGELERLHLRRFPETRCRPRTLRHFRSLRPSRSSPSECGQDRDRSRVPVWACRRLPPRGRRSVRRRRAQSRSASKGTQTRCGYSNRDRGRGGIDGKRNIDRFQQRLHLFKVRTAVVAEIIRVLRRTLGNLTANGAFAVQNTHGVALQAWNCRSRRA